MNDLLPGTSVAPPTDLFDAVPADVSIYEVGPRDGLQNEKAVLPTERKLELIEGAVEAGIRRIEVTSFVDPRWIPALDENVGDRLAQRLAA